MSDISEESENTPCQDNSYGMSEELSKELILAIEDNQRTKVKQIIENLHFADIGAFIEAISTEKRNDFIKIIRDQFNPQILVDLDNAVCAEVLEILGKDQSANAINTLDKDDAVEVVENLDEISRQEILEAMPTKKRQTLEDGLAYPEDSAGRLIEDNIVSIPQFWTVGQTIDYLRASKNLPNDFSQIFVVDPKLVPVGGAMVSKILRSSRQTKIKDIMYTDLRVIHADMDQEEVAFIFQKYKLVSAPVVNPEGRMIGVIELEDIVDIIEEEAQEDIFHLGGIKETDLHSNTVTTLYRRFPWLFLNLGTAIIASIVIWFFDDIIAKFATLAVLMPIAASMGGNAGTQSITVIVRAIATKELNSTNILRIIFKEISVGLLNGLSFALITAGAVYLWYEDFYLSMVFGASMIITLLVAGFAGVMIPVFLERIKVDPAISSSVLLTTITDVVSFATFLGMAAIFLL